MSADTSGNVIPQGDFTTADLATQFRCSRWKVTEIARQLGVGMNLGGRAGYRFTTTDVDQIRESLRPTPIVEKRRTA